MNPRKLQDNSELVSYLVSLSDALRTEGRANAADDLMFASRMAVGSPSEFLHEAQQALRATLATCSSVLTEEQLADIQSVIEQIEIAFQKVGGA